MVVTSPKPVLIQKHTSSNFPRPLTWVFSCWRNPPFLSNIHFLSAYFLLGAIAFSTQFNFKISQGGNVAATATCLSKFGLSSPGSEVVSGKQLLTEAVLRSDHWSQWTKAGVKHFLVANAPSHFPLPSVNRWLVNRSPNLGCSKEGNFFQCKTVQL